MNTNIFQRYAPAVAVLFLTGALTTLLSWGGGSARAQQKSDVQVFGGVNTQQVLNESKARKRDFEELNQMVQNLRVVIQRLREGGARFLSQEDMTKLAELLEKPMPSDAEKKLISDLEDKAAVASAQKRRLENTASPNEEQRKQYAALNDAEQKGTQALNTMAEKFTQRVEAREVELNNKTVTEIKGVIARIAKEKGLSVVFDNQVAVYTANDITDEVIKQINK